MNVIILRRLLASLILLLSLSASAQTFDFEGEGTSQNPYKIRYVKDFITLSNVVMSGTSTEGIYFEQMDDIQFSSSIDSNVFFPAPIGGWKNSTTNIDIESNPSDSVTYAFRGIYNGNNYEVSDYFLQKPDNDYVGLFGLLGANGKILKLRVRPFVEGLSHVGGLVGYNSGGTISNCYSYGMFKSYLGSAGALVGTSNRGEIINSRVGSGPESSISNVSLGGIVGELINGKVTNCSISEIAMITSTGDSSHVGGIVGKNNGGIVDGCSIAHTYVTGQGIDSYVGGIVGLNTNNAKVLNSYYASASVQGIARVGGIVGSNINGSIVEKCYSTNQSRVALYFNIIDDKNPVDVIVGGIVGYNDNTSAVTKSYSEGMVSGFNVNYIGGLVGYNSGSVTECYSKVSTIDVGGYNGVIVGGLVGYNSNLPTAIVNNTYSNSSVYLNTTSPIAGGLIGHNAGGVSSVLNSYSIYNIDAGGVDGTPSIGAFIGINDVDGSIINSYYQETPTPSTSNGNNTGILSKTLEQLKDVSMIAYEGASEGTSLNFNQSSKPWKADYSIKNINDGYPILSFQRFIDLEGSGTELDPFKIRYVNDLITLSNYVMSEIETSGINTKGMYFEMMNDINFNNGIYDSCYLFTPIGGWRAVDQNDGSKVFNGIFDGKGYKVQNLSLDKSLTASISVGLFGELGKDGIIKNLGTEGGILKGFEVGGLISSSSGYVDSCYSKTSVEGVIIAGGLIGRNQGTVEHSYSKSNVSSISTNSIIGGLIGSNTGALEQCYSEAELQGIAYTMGGLVGENMSGNMGTISNSYSKSKLTSSEVNSMGGLVGDNQFYINNCFSISDINYSGEADALVGGLIGNNIYSVSNSYSASNISDANSTNSVGMFAGYTGNSSNNYYVKGAFPAVGNNPAAQGIEEKTAEQMKSTEAISLLNYNQFDPLPWDADGSVFNVINYGFPVLWWQDKLIPDTFIVASNMRIVVPNTYAKGYPKFIIVKEGGSYIDNTDRAIQKGWVERELPVKKWALLSSPVGEVDAKFLSLDSLNYSQINSNRFEIAALKYDYNTNNWDTNYLKKDSVIHLGHGIFAYPMNKRHGDVDENDTIAANSTVIYNNGVFFNKDTTLNFVNSGLESGGATKGKWISLGNPYQAPMYIEQFGIKNSGKIQGGMVYLYDSGEDDWVTVVDGVNQIKPAEGFMVSLLEGNTTESFLLDKTQLTPPSLGKKSSKISSYITLEALSAGNSKKAYLNVNENSTRNFDNNDAYVMIGQNENIVTPYFMVNGREVFKNEFDALPYFMPLRLNSYKNNNEVTISLKNLPDDVKARLIDTYNNIEKDITDSTYSTVLSSGDNSDRFTLILERKKSSIDLPSGQDNNILFWSHNRNINIEGKDLQRFEVYDMLGKIVYSSLIKSNIYTTEINSILVGAYSINVISKTGNKTFKLVISK